MIGVSGDAATVGHVSLEGLLPSWTPGGTAAPPEFHAKAMLVEDCVHRTAARVDCYCSTLLLHLGGLVPTPLNNVGGRRPLRRDRDVQIAG